MSENLNDQLAALRRAGRKQLTDRWRELYKAAPPAAFTPDLLARGISWRLQERVLGSLSNKARQMIGSCGGRPAQRSTPRMTLHPGNRLVRRWRGRTYVVEVTEAGLVYNGERHSSLSVIAGKITGTRWSGPKFFGLVK